MKCRSKFFFLISFSSVSYANYCSSKHQNHNWVRTVANKVHDDTYRVRCEYSHGIKLDAIPGYVNFTPEGNWIKKEDRLVCGQEETQVKESKQCRFNKK